LHIAPEPCLSRQFRSLPHIAYSAADLRAAPSVEQMDITNIGYPPETFDIVFCSHVLEHVENDRKAISEFHRVLTAGGWAILMVPIAGKKTYEDPRIKDPHQRQLHFGQWDHVRQYGTDFASRLEQRGMKVNCFHPKNIATGAELVQMAISKPGMIFFCRK
jgi:ubiquinone/menaquinone biosynthesis C-methylase UbiE